ncbi:MAG: reductase DrgA [Planctomycetes bacterium]|mgnify:CR=1 FL=1|nr:reductase DrgA [Planctomycetota bacterium]
MEVTAAIRQRRSVKQYDPEHRLTEDEIRHLLGHAMLSPTSFNMQNWHFVAVTDREVQTKLCAAAWNQAQVRDCSLTLVITGRMDAWKDMTRQLRHAPENVQEMFGKMVPGFYSGNDALERDECVRSVGIAGQTVMLLAKDMGYDSCPMIGFDPAQVSEILALPETHAPLLMITIGKALAPARPRMGLLSFDEAVSINRFGNHTLSGQPDES